MTVDQVIDTLKLEKQQRVPSRFPCRAIMVGNISFSFCKQCLCAYKGQRTRTALKICRACSACWDAIPVPMNITFRDGCALLWSAERAFCKNA